MPEELREWREARKEYERLPEELRERLPEELREWLPDVTAGDGWEGGWGGAE